VIGPVPEAPGLADLDQLYPDKILIEEIEEGDELPAPFPLPLPLPLSGDMGGGVKTKKSGKKGKKILGLLLLLLIGLSIGAAEYMMYIDIINFS
jgi:hypothetical protein